MLSGIPLASPEVFARARNIRSFLDELRLVYV
jgi:hypothetical protein